jgi:hypothetical protein
VRLLLATNHLGLGGSESYLLTVAEQLQRLGHEVAVFTAEEEAGGAAVARERGVPLCEAGAIPGELDAAIVQDAAVSYEIADRRPSLPQLFVAHSESFDLQAPPQLGGAVRVVVALNDRVAARMRSFGAEREVARLRQPIDTERFAPRSPLPERPRRALLLSNTPHGDRIEMLEAACAANGIELARVGGLRGQTSDPRQALHAADIVIGYGRSILEGMACGRAAYVYDWNGGDGWVTRQSYPAIEADGIAGRSGRSVLDAEKLSKDLRDYSPAMGSVNHDLVIAHHRANVHAQELIELIRGLDTPAEAPGDTPLLEMARLVRLEWRARVEARSLAAENARLRAEMGEVETRLGEAQVAAHEEAEKAARRIHGFEDSISWRLTIPVRFLGLLLRRLRRRSAQ